MSKPVHPILRFDGTDLKARTDKLGYVQRRILLCLFKSRAEILRTGRLADKAELERIGIPWKVESVRFQFAASCARALMLAEGRGLILRQSEHGNRAADRRSNGASIGTTHVKFTPAGLLIAERLSAVADSQQRVRGGWAKLGDRAKAETIIDLIEWQSRRKRYPTLDVLALIDGFHAGKDPDSIAWVREFGAEELEGPGGVTPPNGRRLPPPPPSLIAPAEELILLRDVPRRVAWLPRTKAGKPVKVTSVYRWSTFGRRGREGHVRLETAEGPDGRCTTEAALRRFFAATAEAVIIATEILVAKRIQKNARKPQ